MSYRKVFAVVIFSSTLVLFEVSGSQLALTAKPDTGAQWLERADSLANIRLPGSAPFHMKVTFHAYPGVDFSRKGKPTIITGDGTFEETWLSINTWRREITFPAYHAVEVRANGVRKYQADSDYEPSRVLMMLDALFYPIPRNLTSSEYPESQWNWKIEHLVAGTMPYVNITHRERGMNDNWFYYLYEFLPNGLLVRSDYLGLVTSWSQNTVYGGKSVPLHLEIEAMNRKLVIADATITAPDPIDPKLFELANGPATPGRTMRPFHRFEIKVGELYDPQSLYAGPAAVGVVHFLIDRHGKTSEIEVIDSPSPENYKPYMESLRSKEAYPSKVDRDPCEWAVWVRN